MNEKRRVGRPDKYVNIECLETGVIYKNITSVALDLNVHRSNVYRTITGVKKTCRGLHFKVRK